MPAWAEILIAAGASVVSQLILGAFVYGRLTEKVKTLADRTVDHGARISNVETVLSGRYGHGERLVALEAWRLEREKNRNHDA